MAGIVVIDDAGTPGTPAGSRFLHLNRKHWAAVIVPPHREDAVRQALRMFVDGMRGDYGVQELHFPEIYGGRGAFKDVPIEKRYEIFDLMAHIFESFELPTFFQTCSPEFLAEMRASPAWRTPDVGWFRLDNFEHVGLLFLLTQVRRFIREERKVLPTPVPVLIDEGLVKAGTSIPVTGWSDVFHGGRLTFRPSHEEPFLQLADFAAFSIARVQWLMASDARKPRDDIFMKIVSAERFFLVNLPQLQVDPRKFSREDYEDLLAEDRLLKGLPVEPAGDGGS